MSCTMASHPKGYQCVSNCCMVLVLVFVPSRITATPCSGIFLTWYVSICTCTNSYQLQSVYRCSPASPTPQAAELTRGMNVITVTPSSSCRLDQVGIAVLSVCSLVIAALLLLTLFLLREGYTCWEARHRKKVELQGSHAMEMNNVRRAHSFINWEAACMV